MAKYCIKCGAQLDDQANFCDRCGAAQNEQAAAQQQHEQKKIPKWLMIVIAVAAIIVGVFAIINGVISINKAQTQNIPVSVPTQQVLDPDDLDDDTDGDDVDITSTNTWPLDGYAVYIPQPLYGTVVSASASEDGSYIIYLSGVTLEQSADYLQNYIFPAGFDQNSIEEDTLSENGRYAFRSYNAEGVMFELVYEADNIGIYIGTPY